MNLPKLESLDVSGKKVIVRLDLDVVEDFTRVENASETLKFLVQNKAKTIIIGHRGRPKGKAVEDFSLALLKEVIGGVADKEINFVNDIVGQEAKSESEKLGEGELILLENLRFDFREEANDESLARELASLAEFYVNEAFAVSHRDHASIVGIPKFLPHKAGIRFVEEVNNLGKVIANPKRPVVIIISGIKEDKVEMAKELTGIADKVLVGGKLPVFFGDQNPNPEKLIIGNLNPDGFDISVNTIERFKEEIRKAGTIVLAGVLGKYEEEGYRKGTKEVFQAVSETFAFKVAGGGDTEAALTIFGLTEKLDWISVGGGAMLEFLAKGTLPGIEALKL